MESVKHLKEQDVTAQALKDKGVALVDFWAPWCGPCRMVSPIVEELAQDYEGKALVGKVNVDDEAGAAAAYRVASIPTLILFKDGEEKERLVGARGKETLEELLDKYLV